MAGNSNDYGTWEWLRAHRIGLGPVYAVLPVLLFGVTLHLLDSGPALLALAAYMAGILFWSYRALGWRRLYFGLSGLASAGWLLWAHLADAAVSTWVWLVCSLSLATVLGAIPWWSDNVRRAHVKMEMVVKNWRVRAERIGLRKTWLSNVKVSDIGWTGKLNWQPGEHNIDKVMAMRADLEGALGLQVGQLRMPPDGRSTSSVNLVAVLKDPHAAAVMWEIPHTEVDGQLVLKQSSILDAIEIGPQEDGSKRRIHLFKRDLGGRHMMIGGTTGSGKSGLLNLLWGALSLCHDVVQWGIDLKGGVELGPWRKCFDWVVDTRDGAITMFKALNAEMDRRYRQMATHPKNGKVQRTWVPTTEDPVIVLSVDETATLLGNATGKELTLVEEIARKGRAAGIVLILATQYPTLEALGTSQIREQIHYGFVFRMQSTKGETFIIPDSKVDAHKIDANRPGTCYVKDGADLDKMPTRVYFLDDPTVAQVADLAYGLGPSLADEVEDFLASLFEEYAMRENAMPVQRDDTENEATENRDENRAETIPDWNETGDVSLGAVTARRDKSLSEVEKRHLAREREGQEVDSLRLEEGPAYEALLAALQEADPDGVQAKDLMAAATRKSSWLYDKLGELEATGKAARTRNGKWAWVGEKVHAG
jgi:S-DNA-T family DNA segregation ATPase FtsK/SpoIIIE